MFPHLKRNVALAALAGGLVGFGVGEFARDDPEQANERNRRLDACAEHVSELCLKELDFSYTVTPENTIALVIDSKKIIRDDEEIQEIILEEKREYIPSASEERKAYTFVGAMIAASAMATGMALFTKDKPTPNPLTSVDKS